MSEEQFVYESTSTYYDLVTKKWKTGKFMLNDKFLKFTLNENDILCIPLKTISSLEKRQSSFIYSAVVVSVGAEKHWFASFPNRDSLYNLLELFWREALFSKAYKTSSTKPNDGTTDLGKDLLNLLHESETTLINAANSLCGQGKQIEETQATVSDINSDLSVAEKFMKNMSFTKSILQLNNVTDHVKQQDPSKCFKVNYTFSERPDENCFWEVGMLFLGEEISLIDEKKVSHISIKKEQIISCQVTSTWKLHLTYSLDGKEKSCYIMCPKLFKLLKCLNSNSSLSEKLVDARPISSSTNPSCSGLIRSISSLSPERLKSVDFSTDLKQLDENKTMISEEDLDKISYTLSNLQSLAAEVNQEQQEQMEKINLLLSDTERTEVRMKADVKKIKKLI